MTGVDMREIVFNYIMPTTTVIAKATDTTSDLARALESHFHYHCLRRRRFDMARSLR